MLVPGGPLFGRRARLIEQLRAEVRAEIQGQVQALVEQQMAGLRAWLEERTRRYEVLPERFEAFLEQATDLEESTERKRARAEAAARKLDARTNAAEHVTPQLTAAQRMAADSAAWHASRRGARHG